MSIKLKKKRIPLLNLNINCIYASSAPEILYTKGDCTFLFLNFLIVSLCNSTSNSLLEFFSFSSVSPEVFLSKHQ